MGSYVCGSEEDAKRVIDPLDVLKDIYGPDAPTSLEDTLKKPLQYDGMY